MITQEFAVQFAREWIEAWNSHDLDRILSHYAEDFEMSSPVIVQLAAERSGTLKGKEAVRAYWAKALAMQPALRFELVHVFVGAMSVVVEYRGHRGLGAEVFWFNASNQVYRAAAHYVT
jgi:hypothetical protein